MSLLKIVTLSLLGLLLPVALAILLIPLLFEDSASKRFANPSAAVTTNGNAHESPRAIHVVSGASYASIASDSSLDPAEDREFLISFYVRFDRLPPAGKRQNIIAKYDVDMTPYPGWAVALHRRATSLRLEAYWQGSDGGGGWFAFDDLELKAKRWYALSVIVLPNKALSAYVQDVSSVIVASPDQNLGASAAKLPPVLYAGGYRLDDMSMPNTDAELVLGAPRPGDTRFQGEVALALVAHINRERRSVGETKQFIYGGSPYIVKKLSSDDIGLWISEAGVDESRFQRAIELRGAATWQPTLVGN